MPTTFTKLSHAVRIGTFAALAFSATATSAFALDPEAFATRVETLMTGFGMTVNLGPASIKGDKVRIEGFTARPTSEPDAQALNITQPLTFSGVEELPGGGYKVAEFTTPDIEYADDDGAFSLRSIRFLNLLLPASDSPSPVDVVRVVGGFSAGPLVVSTKGAEVLRIDSIVTDNKFEPAQDAAELADVRSEVTFGNIGVDMTSMPMDEGGAVMQQLGLTKFNGRFSESLHWSPAKGDLQVSSLVFDITDVGKLELSAGLSGYTLALLNSIYEAGKQMQALNPDTDAAKLQASQQALGMSVLAQLSVTGMSIRYDDASLAEKLINFMATQQNMPPAAMREGLKAAALQLLGSLGTPQLTELASGPVLDFLSNPKSFQISVAPSRPLSLIQMVGLAAAPQALLQVLQPQITANK